MESVNQEENKPKYEQRDADRIKPWQWKKGQSGNPKGRPKGKTMKEYAREHLSKMTDEEREAFFIGLDKAEIWRMAEGNPESKQDVNLDATQSLIGLIKHGTTKQEGDTGVSGEDSE